MQFVVTHTHGDFDALAAVVAAVKIYPGAAGYLPEPLHENVRSFVNLYRDALPLGEVLPDATVPDLAVVVDTQWADRLGPYAGPVRQSRTVHLYDHHPGPGGGLEKAQRTVEPVGAVTTLLVELIRRRSLPLSELEATLFALGIYEDTGCLVYPGTTPRDVEAVLFLWESGLKEELLQEYLRFPLTTAQKGLLEKLMAGTEHLDIHGRRVALCSTVTDEYVRGAATLTRLLLETESAEALIIVVRMGRSIHLSARAASEDLDLRAILSPLGARGHPQAVAASLSGAELQQVRRRVVELLEAGLPPQLTAGEIASTPVHTVDAAMPAAEALELLNRMDHGGFPVLDEGKLAGVISRRDLHKAMRGSLGHAPVKGFMSRRVITAQVTDSVTDLRRIMVEENIGRIPLLDGNGSLAGIVTRSDLLRAIYRLDRGGQAVPAGRETAAQPDKALETAPVIKREQAGEPAPVPARPEDRREDRRAESAKADLVREEPVLTGAERQAGLPPRDQLTGAGAAEPLPAPARLQGEGIAQEAKPGIMEVPTVGHGDNLLPLFTERLPDRLRSVLLLVSQRADLAGFEVYLVGGVIRDLLLGCPLPHDLDFVVLPEAPPLARDLQKYLGGTLKENEQFGTATLYLQDGIRLDLVTARREFYAAPAALPQVEPSSLKNDLYRRDFTINTLACSLLARSFGRLVDFFSGVRDLRQGCLRTLYNLSFIDDPLRIIRAVRFTVRFGFTVEEETRDLMLKAIRGRALEKVSRQRLNNEISLIYAEESPPKILSCLEELGALPFLYPRLRTGPDTWRRLQLVQKSLGWSRTRDWPAVPRDEPAYVSALLYGLEPGERALMLRRLQLSRDISGKIAAACAAVPAALDQIAGKKLLPRVLAGLLEPLPPEALVLLHALGGAGGVREQILFFLDTLRHRKPSLSGEDLKAEGFKPGPLYRQILDELKGAVLDELVRTRAEELALVRTLLAQYTGGFTRPAARGESPETHY